MYSISLINKKEQHAWGVERIGRTIASTESRLPHAINACRLGLAAELKVGLAVQADNRAIQKVRLLLVDFVETPRVHRIAVLDTYSCTWFLHYRRNIAILRDDQIGVISDVSYVGLV